MAARRSVRSGVAWPKRGVVLLDSNIIIYASMPEHEALRGFVERHVPSVSVISKIETLGYHRLRVDERRFLQEFFDVADVIPVTDEVVDFAISIRQNRRTTLGDALIGATALVHAMPLVTRNVSDFNGIKGLELIDPLEKHD